jgi:hypothetical protein
MPRRPSRPAAAHEGRRPSKTSPLARTRDRRAWEPRSACIRRTPTVGAQDASGAG